jgi:hypothetical protein
MDLNAPTPRNPDDESFFKNDSSSRTARLYPSNYRQGIALSGSRPNHSHFLTRSSATAIYEAAFDS